MVSGIGMLIMFIGMVMYFVLLCLKYFGFVKTDDVKKSVDKSNDVLKVLTYCKELQTENVLTTEEFASIKAEMLGK